MGNTTSLTPKHFLLLLSIVIIWGVNFVAVFIGLRTFPPFLLSALRFGLSALPWVFFLPRPKAPLKLVVYYGVLNFAMQFGLIFTGIHLGISPGLASLVLQIQVFFSMGLAFLFFHDRPSPFKIAGSLISFIGIGIVAFHVEGDSTFLGLILMLLAALSWSGGNIFTKKIHAESPLALVVWGNLFAFPVMVAVSLFFEGPAVIMNSLNNMSWTAVGAVLYIVYMSTHVGYGAWSFLMKSYSTSVVVPFTLLVPVVGFVSSAIYLGEPFPMWKFVASLFILGGLIFGLLEKQVRGLIRGLQTKV
ncbi:EamA family transporter [Daejeonella sp. H1SJ63]|jgi:O-acetylserine/cysteine efflux transporter|uniref:EamA family transporter n=1 Tax=Daejeonella sp. H1SJ63 TaxID=3034145 RepID=UPI0023ECDA69|nr:EamA family transporter [Daejeonella sp. H1SJ63]